MVKRITLSFSCLIFTTMLVAQKIEEGFDINFKPVESGWRYYVVTEKKDNLWYREAYYLPEKSLAMIGSYKDKDCKIAEGKITWYYPNKNLKSSISYKNGKEEGTSLNFHDNGMMSDSEYYVEQYGLVPSFKAGIHIGEATVGEIGIIKKDIVFSGDVLNTTSRIEGECNRHNVNIILSSVLLQRMPMNGEYRKIPLGDIHLKGKEEKLSLSTIELV
jgi:hypothetical protein